MTEAYLKIRPPGRWGNVRLREFLQYRELLWVLGLRDITVRYRQTFLGAGWVLVGPLLSAGVFSFVFGNVAGLSANGLPYFAFSFGGLLAWNVFSTTLSKTSTCLVANTALISKVYFPRLVLPVATVLGTLVNFLIGLVVMFGLMLYFRLDFHLGMLLLPVWLILIVLLALGIGFVLAAAAVSWRDVSLGTPLLTSLLLYASPIAYSTDAVPERFQTIYLLNPLAGLLEGFRHALFGVSAVNTFSTVYAVVVTAVTLAVGLIAFSKMEPRFTDVI